MRYSLLFIFLLFVSITGFAQIEIQGTVKDIQSEDPLGSSTVVLSPIGKTNILGYGISDSQGKFKVKVNTELDSLLIKISSLGYETFEKKIEAKDQNLEIFLDPKLESLEEIFLRKPPIVQRGDTLIFDPNAFKSAKDRSIQDVLAKMPGIEIQATGEIHYQGKPINKFYVEGLDLMGGQYGMISNNLSADKVKSVEIIENHQPLKVLDSIEPSDQAAINLKLKNNVTLSGNAEVGAGATPGLWYANLTPMFFFKNFQALATYKTNNTGTDINTDFSRFSTWGFRYGSQQDQKNNWMSLAGPSTPPFASKRWLDNESHAGSLNILFKNKKDYEFKINSSYINDFTKRKGGSSTVYSLPEGQVLIEDQTQRHGRDESMEVSLNIERNQDSRFMKNQLTFAKEWDRASAFLTENEDPQNQFLRNPFSKVDNAFEIIFPMGKQLLTLSSNIGYNESPQSLGISPGVFPDILSEGNPADLVKQNLMHKRLFANHSVSLTKKLGDFSLTLRPGIDFSRQSMDSQILLDGVQHGNSDFQNDVRWNQFSTYIGSSVTYRTDRTRVSLSVPLNFTSYKVDDRLHDTEQDKNTFTVNPFVWGEYKLFNYWKITGTGGFNKGYGPIENMYSGYLLTHYRSLGRMDVPLMENTSKNISGGLEYRNPITSWFGRINYSHSSSKRDLIFNTITQANGSVVTEAIKQDNKTSSNSVRASISRLISPIKTTFTLNGNYSHSNSEMLYNGDLLSNKSDSYGGSLQLSSDFTDWITTEYTGSLSASKTRNAILSENTVTTQNHKFGLYLYLFENHTLNFAGEWRESKLRDESRSDFFGDFMYRFTLSQKNKIDIEFLVNNVFNTDMYRNISVGTYTTSESYYFLRPRQFLVKVRFPLG